MENRKVFSTRKIAISGIVIALYAILMYFTQGFAFGQYQIRIATALYSLSALAPYLIVPLGIGNMISNTLRFGELKKKMPKITQKMLTQQLKSLEENGLVNRFAYNEIPPKVEYSLIYTGKTLILILENLSEWAHEYININKSQCL